jgi:hypothetical protein
MLLWLNSQVKSLICALLDCGTLLAGKSVLELGAGTGKRTPAEAPACLRLLAMKLIVGALDSSFPLSVLLFLSVFWSAIF